MDKVLDTLSQYLGAAQGILAKYGPQVWDATLALVRFNAIFNLVMLVVWTAGVIVIAKKLLPPIYVKTKETIEDHPGWLLAAIFATGGEIVCGVMAVVAWSTSFPFWIGAFRPDLAVLYRVAEKAGIL